MRDGALIQASEVKDHHLVGLSLSPVVQNHQLGEAGSACLDNDGWV